MVNVYNDVEKTDLIRKGYCCNNFDKIYFASNENIKGICSHLDLKNKKVLSVLSSGDQAFHLYNNGAKSIDLFDINNFCLYYYYLRLWFIKYMDVFYPPLNIDNDTIKDILKLVNLNEDCNSNAYLFWEYFVKYYSDEPRVIQSMFKEEPCLYNRIDDVNNIIKAVKNDKINFYNFDISDSNNNITKKYDVVYISNIPHWCISKLDVITANLYDLINDDGMIIGANLRRSSGYIERDAFDKKFIFSDLPYTYNEKYGRDIIPGYCLRKKPFSKKVLTNMY